VKGRKRHLLVDTEGLLLHVVVHAADIEDRDGGRLVLAGLETLYARLRHLWSMPASAGVSWAGSKPSCSGS
jgi:putative transposase